MRLSPENLRPPGAHPGLPLGNPVPSGARVLAASPLPARDPWGGKETAPRQLTSDGQSAGRAQRPGPAARGSPRAGRARAGRAGPETVPRGRAKRESSRGGEGRMPPGQRSQLAAPPPRVTQGRAPPPSPRSPGSPLHTETRARLGARGTTGQASWGRRGPRGPGSGAPQPRW